VIQSKWVSLVVDTSYFWYIVVASVDQYTVCHIPIKYFCVFLHLLQGNAFTFIVIITMAYNFSVSGINTLVELRNNTSFIQLHMYCQTSHLVNSKHIYMMCIYLHCKKCHPLCIIFIIAPKKNVKILSFHEN
jgi:hypothetical protein